MKKLLSLILAFCMVLIQLPIDTFATEQTPVIKADKETIYTDTAENLSVNFSVSNTNKLRGLSLRVLFDKEEFELISWNPPKATQVFPDGDDYLRPTYSNVSEANSNGFFSLTLQDASGDDTIDISKSYGATATFKLKSTANLGKYNFVVEQLEILANGQNLATEAMKAPVTVFVVNPPITSVAVTAPKAPVKFEKLGEATIASGANYTVSTAWEPNDTNANVSTIYTATITLTAKENYAFAENITAPEGFTLKSKSAKEVVLTKVYKETAPKELKEISVAGENEIKVSQEKKDSVITLSVNGKYDNGETASDLTVTSWKTSNLPEGVKFENGKLTVAYNAKVNNGDKLTVTATVGNLTTAERVITVNKPAAVASELKLTSAVSSVTIPSEGEEPNTADVTVELLDQYGETNNTEIGWSIDPHDLSVNFAEGKFKVSAGAAAGEYTLMAYAGNYENNAQATIKFTVSNKLKPEITGFADKTVSYKEAFNMETAATTAGKEPFKYSYKGINGTNYDSEKAPAEVGEYEVTAYFVNAKYEGSAKAKLTITPKAATYSFDTLASHVYSGKADYAAHTAKVTADIAYTIQYKLASEADTAYKAEKPVNAGKYHVRVVTDNKNYTLTGTPASFEITKKPVSASDVTIETKNISKPYDTKNNVAGDIVFTFKGVGNDGTITVTAKNNTYANAEMGTDKVITLGEKTGAKLENYEVTYPVVKGAITAQAAKYTISGDSSTVYGNTYAHKADVENNLAYKLQYKPENANDDAYTDAAPVNAGKYKVRAVLTNEADKKNYTLTGEPASFEITKKSVNPSDVTVETKNITKVYDGNDKVSGNITFTFAGAGNDGKITITASENTYNNKNVGTDKPIKLGTIKAEGLDNYSVTYPEVKGTITAKPVTAILSNKNITKTYDGDNSAADIKFTFKGENNEGDLAVTVSGNKYDNKTAGTEKPIALGDIKTGTGIGNYDITYPEVKGAITAKAVNVEITGKNSFVYGEQLDLAVSSKDIVNGDNIENVVELKYNGTPKNVGSYEATAVLKSGVKNYTLNPVTAKNFEITQKTVDIVISGDAKAEFGEAYKHSASAQLIAGDSANYTVKYKAEKSNDFVAEAPKVAGKYTITASLDNANYKAGKVTGVTSFEITKKEVTNVVVATSNITKVYDGNNSVDGDIEFTFDGVGTNNKLKVVAKNNTYNDKNEGTGKSITLGTISGAGLDNYNIHYPEVKGSITAKPVDVEITISYDGKAEKKALTYGTAYEYSAKAALIGDDTTDFVFKYKSGAGSFENAKPVNAGDYEATAEIANKNYKVNSITGDKTFTIAKAEITSLADKTISVRDTDVSEKTFNISKFGKAPCEGTWTLVSNSNSKIFAAEPVLSGNAITFKMNDSAVKDDKSVVTVKFTPDVKPVNYEPVEVKLTIDVIDKLPVVPVVSIANWTYGDNAAKPSYEVKFTDNEPQTNSSWTLSYAGKADNDEVYEASETAPALPGTYTLIVTYRDDSHMGSESVEFKILPKTLSFTGVSVKDKVYNEGTKAELEGTLAYVGIINSDEVAAPEYSKDAKFADSAIGNDKLVTVAVTSKLEGKDAWKYTAPSEFTVKGSITAPKAPVIIGDENNGMYLVTMDMKEKYDDYSSAIKALGTVEEIQAKMKEEAVKKIPSIGENIMFVDIQLMSGDKEDHEIAVSFIVPYPEGSDKNKEFTVVHVDVNGNITSPEFTKVETGIRIADTTTTPFAFAWKTVGSSHSGGGHHSEIGEERNFWKTVIEAIEDADKNDVIKVDAKDYDKMSWDVMQALKNNPTVSLIVDWNGGSTITIPAGKALDVEGGRIFYPLSYLEKMYAGSAIDQNGVPTVPSYNPATGGYPIFIEAPVTVPSVGLPTITPADEGIDAEAAIIETAPVVEESTNSGRNVPGAMAAFSVAGLSLAGAAYVLIKRKHEDEE